jgi:broad specificity phosphatase PhoE
MSQLFLVRHGQASFLQPDYDKLSAKGETQSRLLGSYWSKHKLIFDAVYSGPRKRQKDTARIVGEEYRKAGVSWGEPEVLDTFDEFRAEAVIAHALPKLVESDEHVRKLHQAFEKARGKAEQFKTFQRVFEVVISMWAAGELPVPGVETWPDFCVRVQRGLQQLTENGDRGRRIVIFSSGGPIGVAMQRSLGLSTEATLRSAWMVPNCAYSEFLFSRARFTLSSYNAYPHLTDPGLQTYR